MAESGRGSQAVTPPASLRGVGRTIRSIREFRGMSLRELARRTNVSAGHISQVERGLVDPSVSLLYSIASVLGTTVDKMFSHGPDHLDETPQHKPSLVATDAADVAVIRRGERRSLRMVSGVEWELLTAEPEKHFSFREIVYPPGASSSDNADFVSHAGREHGLVLEGELHIQLEFSEYVLRPGDSISYNSAISHRLWNPSGTDTVRAIWIQLT